MYLCLLSHWIVDVGHMTVFQDVNQPVFLPEGHEHDEFDAQEFAHGFDGAEFFS